MHYVKRINDECGGQGLHLALLGWVDTYVDHATGGDPDSGRPKMMKMLNGSTGEMETVEESGAPDEVKWAARFVYARACLDFDACDRLLDELPEDGFEVARYVQALLRCVAESMNGLPRGFARLGQR